MASPSEGGGWLDHLNHVLNNAANTLGVSVPIVKFFSSMLAGYLFALIFLLLPKPQDRSTRSGLSHVYFAGCGLVVSVFCFGQESLFNLASVVVSYVSIQVLGTGRVNVLFTFVFQLGYLVGAYTVFASEGYDINWTTPQCMLCLKLIGLAWDCHDGNLKKKGQKLRPYQEETCYQQKPTLLEMLGFSYFFGSFLAGPLFSFTRYLSLADGTLVAENAGHGSRILAACRKFIAAVLTFAFYSYYAPQFPCDYFLTEEFSQHSFWKKTTVMMLTYHANFAKYVFTWMFAEGMIIISGLGFNGVDEERGARWDALTNFKYRKFLFGPFFQDVLEGFNMQTNNWCGKYVFRRLAFLGNKTLSHITTMAFLAIWHGFYIGYVILFAIEFCYLTGERTLCENLKIITGKEYQELKAPLRIGIRLCSIVFRAYICSFAAAAFMLLTWPRVHVAYSEVYYWGIIGIAVEGVVIFVTGRMAAAKRRAEKLKEN